MLNSILYTNTSNIENYTKQYKDILGLTSVWFLVVGYYGTKNQSNYIKFCGLYIVLCGLLSLLFWYNPICNSIYHYLDKYIATIYFVQFFIVNLLTNCKYLHFSHKVALFSSIILFFVLSDYFLQKDDIVNAFWCHLLFRYICYVGLLWTYNPNIELIFRFTIIYFTYNFYLLDKQDIEYIIELFIIVFIAFIIV